MKVKQAPRATKKLVLCVYGITTKGTRQLVYFQQEASESETAWGEGSEQHPRAWTYGRELEADCDGRGARTHQSC